MALTQGELMFARNLDEQLLKYQDDTFIHNNLNNNYKNKKMNNTRPQFITTVKKGSFLEPPPEIAILLGLTPTKSSAASPQSGSTVSVSSTSTQQPSTGGNVIMYSYASKPKIIHKNYHTDCSRRHLNNAREGPYGNVMNDRRVVRGSTYAVHANETLERDAKQREARRRAQARRKARVYSSGGARHTTPPPVPGRRHEPVQTERYLEELLDRPQEAEATCQTDLFLEPPDTAAFLGAELGVDRETQIYPGDLADFDYDVMPILENLVRRAMEESLTEVLEEEELLDIQIHQRRLQENQELEELQKTKSPDGFADTSVQVDLIGPSEEPAEPTEGNEEEQEDEETSEQATELSSDQAIQKPYKSKCRCKNCKHENCPAHKPSAKCPVHGHLVDTKQEAIELLEAAYPEFHARIGQYMPSILEKLRKEQALENVPKADVLWLLDLTANRLETPEVLEDFIRQALPTVIDGTTKEDANDETKEEEGEKDGSKRGKTRQQPKPK